MYKFSYKVGIKKKQYYNLFQKKYNVFTRKSVQKKTNFDKYLEKHLLCNIQYYYFVR